MIPTYPHHSFSREIIDSQPLPVVSRDLLPWLIKDRREAETGAFYWDTKKGELVPDGSGLEHAEKDVRQATAKLEGNLSADMRAIWELQLAGARGKAEFYRGKMYLLDKVIAATKGSA